MEQTTIDQIEKLLSLSETDILINIGREVDSGIYAFPPTPKELIDKANSWWNYSKKTIIKEICFSEKVCEAIRSEDKIVLYAAILDVLSGIISGVSPVTASALVIKKGIEKLCESYWR